MQEEAEVTFAEIKAILKQNAIAQAEFRKDMQELKAQQAKTGEQIRELKAQQAKTDEQIAQTDSSLTRLEKLFGDYRNNHSDMVEEFIYNSLKRNGNILWGISFDYIQPNVSNRIGKLKGEYDVVLYNGNAVAIVEIKNKAHIHDLESFDKKITNFRILFPMYEKHKIYIGLASLHMNSEVISHCQQKGYGVVRLAGQTMEDLNHDVRAFLP